MNGWKICCIQSRFLASNNRKPNNKGQPWKMRADEKKEKKKKAPKFLLPLIVTTQAGKEPAAQEICPAFCNWTGNWLLRVLGLHRGKLRKARRHQSQICDSPAVSYATMTTVLCYRFPVSSFAFPGSPLHRVCKELLSWQPSAF